MKKIMKLLLCSAITLMLKAESLQAPVVKSDASAHAITYTVTVYHDEEDYDKEKWEAIVNEAMEAIQSAPENDEACDKVVASFVKGIEMIYQTSKTTNPNGIHGEMSIAIGDNNANEEEMEQTKGCFGACPCITKYQGKCPCVNAGDCCAILQEVEIQ